MVGLDEIRKMLFELRDHEYKLFHSKLMPTVDADSIIGVRVPDLRRLAKSIYKEGTYKSFICELPHCYYEENNLHAFLIEQIKDYDIAIEKTNQFLPFVDNWATCDCFSPKIFKNNKSKLLLEIKQWISSDKPYTIRFGVGMLMRYFLDDDFSTEYPLMVSKIVSNEYYVNMMIAWYFATALSKHFDDVLPYISDRILDKWIINKTIQKAVESYRLDDSKKEILRKYRIK